MPSVRRRVRRIVRRRVRDRLRRLPSQLSARTSARRLVLLFITFVFVAATAAFVCVEPPAASACPVVMPKPLRVLYGESDLVAVVRVGDSVPVETEDDAKMRKTALRISSLLKGESKERVVNVYHYVWEELDESKRHAYVKDDVLLVFLNTSDDGYISADYERGVKKLPPDELKVYVKRIEELASLMSSEKTDNAALTEWLVRCAEEPATRWEGAYELAADASLFADPKNLPADTPSAEFLGEAVDNDAAQAKSDDNSAARAPATRDAAHNAVNESGVRVEPGEVIRRINKAEERSGFAAHLTPAHKERLTNALLAAEEFDSSDHLLLRLVGNWQDERLVPYSLKHLARMADNPHYHAEDLMRIVAHTLADKTLIKLATDYSETATYDDLYDSEEDYNEVEEDSEITAEERAANKKAMEEMRAAGVEARFVRSGKLRHFLALADQPQKP